jgi:hypothetical protein
VKDASERCRNCGSLAPGRYCAACGQETDIALPSAALSARGCGTLHRLRRPAVAFAACAPVPTRPSDAGIRRGPAAPLRTAGTTFVALWIALFAILRIAAGPPIGIETTAPRAANTIGDATVDAFASMRAVYGGSWRGALLRGAFVFAAYAVFFGLAIAALLLAAVTL